MNKEQNKGFDFSDVSTRLTVGYEYFNGASVSLKTFQQDIMHLPTGSTQYQALANIITMMMLGDWDRKNDIVRIEV